MSTEPLAIDRLAIEKYFLWSSPVMHFSVFLILVWGIGIPLGLLWIFLVGPYVTRRQAAALSYRLENGTLYIESGVWFRERKAIPLRNVTDLTLEQGPVAKRFGIWTLAVQTAGSDVAEARLYGLQASEAARTHLLAAREQPASGRGGSA